MNKKVSMTLLMAGALAVTSYSFAYATSDDSQTVKLADDGVNIEVTEVIDGQQVTTTTAVGVVPTEQEETTSAVDADTFFDVETDAALKDRVLAEAQKNTDFTQYTPNELQIAFNSMNDDEWMTFSTALTDEQWTALNVYMYGVE